MVFQDMHTAGELMTFLSERPQITSVFLCLDNDQAGNEACEKLAGEISEGYSVIRLKPSKKDWNEILCDKNTDRKKAITETITIKVPEKEELVPMLCYEDIEQTSVDWLWFPYIPFGKLTIIQGNPGEGKTYFAMLLTAACTNRKLDEKAKEQGISGRTMRDVRSRMKNELEYRANEKQENSILLKE